MTFGLEMADHGFDRGSASQFAFDDAEHGALLAGDEDAAWILRIVSTVPLSLGSSSAIQLCMNKTPVAISLSKVRARFHDLVVTRQINLTFGRRS